MKKLLLSAILLLTAFSALAGNGTLNNNGELELTVNFRFPPGEAVQEDLEDVITGAARLICDATDGQMILTNVGFTEGQMAESTADIWVTLQPGRSRGGVSIVYDEMTGEAIDALPGLGTGNHILWMSSGLNSTTLAHELGHYLFGLGEQYSEQERSGDFLGEDCGIGPGFEHGFGDPTVIFDPQNNSIMGRGSLKCLPTPSLNNCDVGDPADPDCINCSTDDDCAAGRACTEVGVSQALFGTLIAVGSYSEFSTPTNHDLRRGTNTTCPMSCMPVDASDCTDSYDGDNDRFEGTHQTLVHGESDWETIQALYPMVFTMPAGLPDEGPASCASVQPTFSSNIEAVDQAILVMDRSHSMSYSVRNGVDEICDNGDDDDNDGVTDEANCAQSRVEFARAAARAFVDLQQDAEIDLGIVLFNDTAVVQTDLDELSPGNVNDYISDIDNFGVNWNTAIGAGIELATNEFLSSLEAGHTQTIFLLSDGRNNEGPDPITAADDFRNAIDAEGGVPRIFTIPVSDSADEQLLADLADQTAMMIKAPTGNELTAIYAELAAVYNGNALVLPRTDGVVNLPTPQSYNIPVENGARALTLFIAGRNDRMADWDINFVLQGPAGSVIEQSYCQELADPYYCKYRVDHPEGGLWTVQITTESNQDQHFTVLASVDNPRPDCFVDVSPGVHKSDLDPVMIEGSVRYLTSLDEGVTLSGIVRRPDGSVVPFNLPHSTNYSSSVIPFDDFAGRGVYEVQLQCAVPPGTEPAKGESIFDGPERPNIEVQPFIRYATTSFFLDIEDMPTCDSTDCDGDGIPNDPDSCDQDTDKDGRPDCWDGDSDGDEIPDSSEGSIDADGDGIPNFQDLDSDDDGIEDTYDPDPNKPAHCDCSHKRAIRGTNGRDHLIGTPRADIICGFGSDDLIEGLGGDDCIDAGDGDDEVLAGRGDDLVIGGEGDDLLNGQAGDDLLLGGQHRDTLQGGEGNDLAFGGESNDLLQGDQGQDHLFGQADNDTLHGGKDDDLLNGGKDVDSLHGDAGNDTCSEGENETNC